jgi:hypothetical protein
MTITNELAEAVLDIKDYKVYSVSIYNTNIRIERFRIVSGVIDTEDSSYIDINLYEFIYLCTVWVDKKGYGILSSTWECFLIEFTRGLVAEWRHQPYMEIQAAQWVLDNNKRKNNGRIFRNYDSRI